MNPTILKIKRIPKSIFCGRTAAYCQHAGHTETFMAALPEVIHVLTSLPMCSKAPGFVDHYKELIKNTVLKEKRFRPSVVLESYKALESPSKFTDEKFHKVTMYAWSIELMQTAMIIHHDIWDQSETRGNGLPWYKKENVGLMAINDGVLLYQSAFALLQKYFCSQNIYPALVNAFHSMTTRTAIGHWLDAKYKRDCKGALHNFNMKTYRTIARYKTCSLFCDGPIIGVLILTDNLSKLKYLDETFAEEIAVAFQVDNDVLDIYHIDGKVRDLVGSDIRNGTCTWPALKILESGREQMIQSFKKNYGRREPECVQVVIDSFQGFGIFEKYREYLKVTRESLEKCADEMPPTLRMAALFVIENVLPIQNH